MQSKGILLVLMTAVISGFSIFLNKFAVSGINPFILTTGKNFLVAIALGLILLQTKKFHSFKALEKKDWLKLLGIAVIGGSIPFLLFFKGLQLGTAIKAAFIHKTMFIYVTLFAFIFLKESISKKQLLGMAALFLGIFALNMPSLGVLQLGDLLVLAATLFWAVEAVIAKNALKKIPGNVVAFSRMAFGVVLLAGFLVFTQQFQAVFTLTILQAGWILFTAALLLGYVLTWYNGLQHINASLAASLLLFGSALTTVLDFIWTANFNGLALGGLILLLAGLSLLLSREISRALAAARNKIFIQSG